MIVFGTFLYYITEGFFQKLQKFITAASCKILHLKYFKSVVVRVCTKIVNGENNNENSFSVHDFFLYRLCLA